MGKIMQKQSDELHAAINTVNYNTDFMNNNSTAAVIGVHEARTCAKSRS